MQGLGRAGVDLDVVFLKPVLGGEHGLQLGLLAEQVVAAAHGGDVDDALQRRLAWAEGVLVGVDQHGVGGRQVLALAVQGHAGQHRVRRGGRAGQGGLGHDRDGGRGGGGEAQEVAAADAGRAGGGGGFGVGHGGLLGAGAADEGAGRRGG